MKPVLLVTSDVPPDRVAPFRALAARTPLVVARFSGGTRRHASAGAEDPGVPVIDVTQRRVGRLAAGGRFRAVVAGTVGRTALPAAYAGARAARTPFVLWSALWSHPHVLSAPLMLHLYRHADAVAAYGEHVAAFAAGHGARNVHLAPQAVDPVFWSERTAARADAPFNALYVGRMDAEKGVATLLEAWRRTGLEPPRASLRLIGDGPLRTAADSRPAEPGITWAGPRRPDEVRNFLGSAGVLVVPSISTRAFREPWALVVNEAMHQGTPVIATEDVGAAAGGLVRDGRNGLVVAAGDPGALAAALRRLHADEPVRRALGEAALRDVAPFTPDAWASAFATALLATLDQRSIA